MSLVPRSYPALILTVFQGRRGDRWIAKQPKTNKFFWSKTLCHRQEVFLGYALMALVLFPIIAWATIFGLVISMVRSP